MASTFSESDHYCNSKEKQRFENFKKLWIYFFSDYYCVVLCGFCDMDLLFWFSLNGRITGNGTGRIHGVNLNTPVVL